MPDGLIGGAAGIWVTALTGMLGLLVRDECASARRPYCCRPRMSGQLADSPFIDQIMPKPKLPRKPLNPLVAALVYDGLCVFEFSCAAEVFGLPRPEFGADWYR